MAVRNVVREFFYVYLAGLNEDLGEVSDAQCFSIMLKLLWLDKKSATVKGKQRIRQASEIFIDVFINVSRLMNILNTFMP